MPEYIAALCQMAGTELVPLEKQTITAANDGEAVKKAVQWQTNTVFAISFDKRDLAANPSRRRFHLLERVGAILMPRSLEPRRREAAGRAHSMRR